jgi:membrane protein
VVATTVWIASTFVFKFHVTNVGDDTASYEAIGGAIGTMLWFYVLGVAILIGAEVNGVIEEAWRGANTESAPRFLSPRCG